jgi:hypothetical protein
LLILGSSFNSFETLDIDDNEPINLIAGEINDLMEEVQLDYPNFIYDIQKEGSELTRLENLFGETYEFSAQQESERNIAWSIAYIDLLPKIEDVISTAETEGYTNRLGVAKVLKAFTLLTLVDFYGDVPYSEIAGPNSNVDDGAIIYAEALTRLEDAIDRFNEGTGQMEVDYYYNNDFQKWTKLANTLRMNVYLNTRLVDADAFVNFNAIASVGNFISNSDDDFEFKYGNANMQHPEYLNNYSSMGVGYSYRSNWLMDKMLSQDDPRIRYYFYRQADSFKRSASGVYPSAGKFDDDEFVLVSVGAGGAGAGITPLMLASWVDFMNSEMALVDGNEGAAQDYLFLGMQKSIEKVMGFISVDSGADATYTPASVDVSNYLTSVVSIFSNGDINAKWNVLAEQQFISHYGNGINSYNTYRRTGFPTFLQYHLTADPGPFVRSLLYPTDEVNDNSNISQKPGVDIQVFWDSNPAYPAFPLAN